MRSRPRGSVTPRSLHQKLWATAWLNPDQPDFIGQMQSRHQALKSIGNRSLGFGVVLLLLVKDDLVWEPEAIMQVWVNFWSNVTGTIAPPSEGLFWTICGISTIIGLGWITTVTARTVAVVCLRNQGLCQGTVAKGSTKLAGLLWLIGLIVSLKYKDLLPWMWGILGLVAILCAGLWWWWRKSLKVSSLEYSAAYSLWPRENHTNSRSPETSLETIVRGQDLWVQPEPLAQQPQQFTAFLAWLLGLFCWTMADFAPWVKAWLSIIMISIGINGVSTWRLGLVHEGNGDDPQHNISLWLDFQGWWGTAVQYVIPLKQFQQLWRIKLEEAGTEVEISWLKLMGYRYGVFLPSVLAGIASVPMPNEANHEAHSPETNTTSVNKAPENKSNYQAPLSSLPQSLPPHTSSDAVNLNLDKAPSQLIGQSGLGMPHQSTARNVGKANVTQKSGEPADNRQNDLQTDNIVPWLCQHGSFILQERSQDSLSLITVLIPQGAGILAGGLLLLLGLALSLMISNSNAPQFLFPSTIGLLCLSGSAPWLARQIYVVLAPNAVPAVLPNLRQLGQTHIAEIAAAGLIVLTAVVGHRQSQYDLLMFLLQMSSWLCVLVGVEIFRWVQRVPLTEKL